jgi:pathogenesis-related protein 1
MKHRGYIGLLIGAIACSACTSNHPQQPPKLSNAVPNKQGLSEPERVVLLKHHNQTRAEVNLKPLTWSNTIAAIAQNWAKKLVNDGCKLQHNYDTEYGENLFIGTQNYTVIDSIKSWANEKADYSGDFLNSANWQKIGHYTQVVWRNTTKIGCGKALCNHQLIVVCHYHPAGNYMGQTPY